MVIILEKNLLINPNTDTKMWINKNSYTLDCENG